MQLTPTSVIVLGLVELAGEATPYDLKQGVAATIGHFWSLPHSQLYAEPERLTKAGLLDERRETTGRRRRIYSITDQGRRELDEWRSDPDAALPQLRDHALLKIFFGADPAAVAGRRVEAHRARLAEYERLMSYDQGQQPRGPWLALESGIRHEREWIDYWEKISRSERR